MNAASFRYKMTNDSSGFTLMELVVVATLLAFLSAILYGTLRGIVQAKEVTEIYRDTEQTAHGVLGRMTLELSGRSLVPLSRKKDDKPSLNPSSIGTPYFVGTEGRDGESDSDRLRFVASNSGQRFIDAPVNYGVVEVEYRLAEDPEAEDKPFEAAEGKGKFLVREEVPALVDSDDIRAARRVVVPIAENVTSLNFRYLKNGKWQNAWNEIVPPFPEAVEITLGLQGPEDRVETFRTAITLGQKQRAIGRN